MNNLKKYKRICLIIFFLLFPLISCENIDNPIGLIFLGGKSITVKNESISNLKTISVDPIKEIDLKVGDEKILLSTLNYKDGSIEISNDDIEWLSEPNNIVQIDKTGKLTAIKTGNTIVTAKSVKGSKKVIILIKVTEDKKIDNIYVAPTITPTNTILVSIPTSIPLTIPSTIQTVYIIRTSSPTIIYVPYTPSPSIISSQATSKPSPSIISSQVTSKPSPLITSSSATSKPSPSIISSQATSKP
ncbi:MAG: Ig-like domain-containing protein [Candidatus Sericytochromatia bacterium]|nr:Ig-like domain-containing protein [Candidatus Sericytochromatia bacterium]